MKLKKDNHILALDVSTKTGWAVGHINKKKELKLLSNGTIPKIEKPALSYPESYITWANSCFLYIQDLILNYQPDLVIIEETARGSKSAYSQKILEYIHFLLATFLVKNKIPTKYLMTGEWRSIVGCVLNNEEKKNNAKVRKYKKKTGETLGRDESGKVLGIKGKKHVNVRRANEIFGLDLKLKDNDMADALCLLYAAYKIYLSDLDAKKAEDSILES